MTGGGMMLTAKMSEIMSKIEQLSAEEQDALAEEIYADLLDARFERKIVNGEPMPLFEALVAQADAEIARGEYISLDEWLDEEGE
jgi:hypothetical protein